MAPDNPGSGSDSGDSVYFDAVEALETPDPDKSLEAAADGNHPFGSSTLENLPAELRDQILLSAPDLSTLRSLVHASPVLHAQYRSNRDAILRTCVARELDGCLVDAHACVLSRVRSLGSPRTNENIEAFLDTYRRWLSGSSPRISVVKPLARHFSTWALANLERAALSSLSSEVKEASDTTAREGEQQHPITLSRSEEVRLFRALYRYETYCHLFGRNDDRRLEAVPLPEINDRLFGLFEPWEAEALACIDEFLRHKYEHLFDQVKDDLHVTNPRFTREDGTVDYEASVSLYGQLDGKWLPALALAAAFNRKPTRPRFASSSITDYMDGTISRGLKMIVKLLAIDNHDTLVSKMQRCLTQCLYLDDPMKNILEAAVQNIRREDWPNVRDEAEQRNDPLEFAGGAVPPDGPPIAWVLLWDGIYANLYGGYIPAALKQWGHVIWSKSRWAGLRAEPLIHEQWESEAGQKLAALIEHDYGWRPGSRR